MALRGRDIIKSDIVVALQTEGTYKRGVTVRNKEESEENVACYSDYYSHLDLDYLFRDR